MDIKELRLHYMYATIDPYQLEYLKLVTTIFQNIKTVSICFKDLMTFDDTLSILMAIL